MRYTEILQPNFALVYGPAPFGVSVMRIFLEVRAGLEEEGGGCDSRSRKEGPKRSRRVVAKDMFGAQCQQVYRWSL